MDPQCKNKLQADNLLVHRTFENIGVALVRKYVTMYSAWLPPLSAEGLNLMLGGSFSDD